MLCRGLSPALRIIHSPEGRHRAGALLIHMGRRKRERNGKCFFYYITEHRHAVSQKSHGFPVSVQLLQKFRRRHRHLSFHSFQPVIPEPVNPCIYLAASGVHDRTDQSGGIVKIIRQSFHRRHADQRFLQRKAQALGRSRTDPQTGKRSRTCRHGYCVYGIQVKFCHLRNFVQHGKQSLRVCFFIVHRIFGDKIIILHHSHRGHDPRTVYSQNLHNLSLSPSSGSPSTVILR